MTKLTEEITKNVNKETENSPPTLTNYNQL